MSSKLGKNFRQGHLAEDLGNLFLRRFCAVSEIRQEDDFGIDSIATLLKPDNNLLYAERSFSVQIKSSSVKNVRYKGKEIEWLVKQEIPFFFCSVNIETNEIELYTINKIFLAAVMLPVESIGELVLVMSESPEFKGFGMVINDGKVVGLVDENGEPIETDANEPFKVYLGPPILKSNLLDAANDGFADKIYNLMKCWLDAEYELIRLRKINLTYLATWKTWEKPKLVTSVQAKNNLKRDMCFSSDYIERLASYLSVENQEDKKLISAFDELENWFNENGINIDCEYKRY